MEDKVESGGLHRTIPFPKYRASYLSNYKKFDFLINEIRLIRAVLTTSSTKADVQYITCKENGADIRRVVPNGKIEDAKGKYGGFSTFDSHEHMCSTNRAILGELDFSQHDTYQDKHLPRDEEILKYVDARTKEKEFFSSQPGAWIRQDGQFFNAFMCFKLTLNSPDRCFDISYRVAKEKSGHCTIFNAEGGCELFYPCNRVKSDVGDLMKAYMDPYELGNEFVSWITGEPRYCWTPCHIFLRTAGDHIWAKYQHHEKLLMCISKK